MSFFLYILRLMLLKMGELACVFTVQDGFVLLLVKLIHEHWVESNNSNIKAALNKYGFGVIGTITAKIQVMPTSFKGTSVLEYIFPACEEACG